MILPGEDDPSNEWNPMNNIWRVFYTVFNPNPDAAPTRLEKPAQIWDLPSPFGKVDNPENKDNIPYFVPPDYFSKLYNEPKYPIVSHDPPVWMTVSNFSASDMVTYMPLATLSGPAYVYATSKGKTAPSMVTLASTALVGLTLGFTLCYKDSENRLQGFTKNEEDVKYWKSRAKYEKDVLSGKVDPKEDAPWLIKQLYSVIGPKPVNIELREKEYYESNE